MVSDVGTMLAACESGVGIAQILQLGTQHLMDRGKLVRLLPDWSDEMFPVYALFPHRATADRRMIES
jgi:DNA-binding transcriptional LysR family regulator